MVFNFKQDEIYKKTSVPVRGYHKCLGVLIFLLHMRINCYYIGTATILKAVKFFVGEVVFVEKWHEK